MITTGKLFVLFKFMLSANKKFLKKENLYLFAKITARAKTLEL